MSSRRDFAKLGLSAAAISLSSFLPAQGATGTQKRKIVCVGGHPDDPETGCGGTMALFTAAGHEVTIIYLTRGEAGIPGKSHEEAAGIRTKEAQAAAKILQSKAVFAGQIDGDTIVNNQWVQLMKGLIEAEKPDLVFTHWPIDSHKDHQAASLLTMQSWVQLQKKFGLYFFEVCAGSQTQGFKPTDYVDITNTREQKKKSVYCHTSQGPDEIYRSGDCNHEMMEIFRGIEIGVPAAEAFVKMSGTTIPV